MFLADAVKAAGVPLPPVQPIAARRIQIANAHGQIPAPLQMLFTLAQGKSRWRPSPGPRLLCREGQQGRSRQCDASAEP